MTINTRTLTIAGLTVVAQISASETGRIVVTRLEISGEKITTDALRKIPIGVIETSARWSVDPADLEAFHGRQLGEDPAAFSERVAKAYRAAASQSHRPNKLLADMAGAPVQTVRGWVREARLRGLLDAGMRGKAG